MLKNIKKQEGIEYTENWVFFMVTRDRIILSSDEMPTQWYNILPDLPEPLPPYTTDDGKSITRLPEGFTQTASDLEFSAKRWISIPDPVRTAYIAAGRPRPLIRAHRLERHLNTPAKIYYKLENLLPGGTFKANTTLPQAYWAHHEHFLRTVIAGAFSRRTLFSHVFAAKTYGLTPTVFMMRKDYRQHDTQVQFLKEFFDADVVASPSRRTQTGRKRLAIQPHHPGSLTLLRTEVWEEATSKLDAVTVVPSRFTHTLITQTIVGLEVQRQLDQIDATPDVLVASIGGGSGFHGLIAPFVKDQLTKKREPITFLGTESETSAKLTRGQYQSVTLLNTEPRLLAKAYQVAWTQPPPPIMAADIQSNSASPLVSHLHHLRLIDAVAYPRDEQVVMNAAKLFLQTEGWLVAPESAYAIRGAIETALECKRTREEKVIVALVSATSFLDFGARTRYVKPKQ